MACGWTAAEGAAEVLARAVIVGSRSGMDRERGAGSGTRPAFMLWRELPGRVPACANGRPAAQLTKNKQLCWRDTNRRSSRACLESARRLQAPRRPAAPGAGTRRLPRRAAMHAARPCAGTGRCEAPTARSGRKHARSCTAGGRWSAGEGCAGGACLAGRQAGRQAPSGCAGRRRHPAAVPLPAAPEQVAWAGGSKVTGSSYLNA